MSQERYFIGPGLKDKLRDVIFRVNSAPHVTSGPHVSHVYSDIPPPIAKAKELRRGTFTGSWSIGGTNTVQVVGSGETVRVTNYCTPILIDDGPTQRFSVIFGDVKGTQTAVEIQSVPGLRRGTFTGAWSIGSTNAVTIHGTTQTISVTNYCVPVAGGTASTQSYNVIFGAVMGAQAVVEVQAGIEGSCRQTIGGEDITTWPGWDATKEQLLGHDASGCLKWFDVAACGETSSGGGTP
jgi:hypothetical protein